MAFLYSSLWRLPSDSGFQGSADLFSLIKGLDGLLAAGWNCTGGSPRREHRQCSHYQPPPKSLFVPEHPMALNIPPIPHW